MTNKGDIVPSLQRPSAPSRQRGVLIATSLMLFSMFFGAGNLIFPPMLGASAGSEFPAAMAGFLIGGVALPVIAIIAVAVSGSDISDLSSRAGRLCGWLFPVAVYLSIGALYGLPRTGTVAYSTAFTTLTGVDSPLSIVGFNLAFFGVALALAWHSSRILDSLGRILTPLLLIFLAILVLAAFRSLGATNEGGLVSHPPSGAYAESPITAGLMQGYLTMDSLAALVFGIIVIRTLRTNGHVPQDRIVPQTSLAAIVAGLLLTAVYVGLGMIGQMMPNADSYTNGADLLAAAALTTMGSFGLTVFALTVLAACLTTAVGLLAACSGFFNRLIPAVPYRMWLVVFAGVTFLFATLGLDALLRIAGPLIGFLYPIGITFIALTLVSPLLSGVTTMPLTFRVGALVSTVWSALATLVSTHALTWALSAPGQAIHDALDRVLSVSPLHTEQLGWVTPVAAACVIAVAIDLATGNQRAHSAS